jgi:hypothetical protein
MQQQPRKKRNKNRSRNNRYNQEQLALVLSGAQTAPVPRMSMRSSTLGNLSKCQKKYLLAITNPFHPNALGASVPDFKSRSSTPFVIRWRAQIGTTSAGPLYLGLVPNPAAFGFLVTTSIDIAVNDNSAFTTSEGYVIRQPSSVTQGIPGVITDQTAGSTTGNCLQPVFSFAYNQFRVVAGGMRLLSLSPSTATSTQISAYQAPATKIRVPYGQFTGGTINGWNGGVNGGQVCNLFYETNYIGLQSSFDVNSRRSFTSREILQTPALFAFKPNSPVAHVFRSSSDFSQKVGDYTIQESGYDTTIVGSTQLGTFGFLGELNNNEGWDGLFLNFSAVTPTSSTGVTFDVEFILHCEGTPTQTSNISVPPSGNSDSEINPYYSMDTIIGIARSAVDYLRFVPRVMNGMSDIMRRMDNPYTRELRTLEFNTGQF